MAATPNRAKVDGVTAVPHSSSKAKPAAPPKEAPIKTV
eukprot:CAMPEP_0170441280 /NCGR_PEP_ID=MMETSP0117_2-20130122/46811_1 /TAXON_ID=400756 /ORGANISM="Durinskia baltica, Strain CSIRO CS-38" /LENGTH=37 /DNA_ID= /DNA_START= /DNA_END= /DNA_ORIENTATION=